MTPFKDLKLKYKRLHVISKTREPKFIRLKLIKHYNKRQKRNLRCITRFYNTSKKINDKKNIINIYKNNTCTIYTKEIKLYTFVKYFYEIKCSLVELVHFELNDRFRYNILSYFFISKYTIFTKFLLKLLLDAKLALENYSLFSKEYILYDNYNFFYIFNESISKVNNILLFLPNSYFYILQIKNLYNQYILKKGLKPRYSFFPSIKQMYELRFFISFIYTFIDYENMCFFSIENIRNTIELETINQYHKLLLSFNDQDYFESHKLLFRTNPYSRIVFHLYNKKLIDIKFISRHGNFYLSFSLMNFYYWIEKYLFFLKFFISLFKKRFKYLNLKVLSYFKICAFPIHDDKWLYYQMEKYNLIKSKNY